jgi:uncharacterized RDD family membrane protein YckC
MLADQEDVSKLFTILAHPLRRELLTSLNEEGAQTFTELLTNLKIDTGTLSFHLRNLKVFLKKTRTGKYRLNRIGRSALKLTRDFESLSIETEFAQNPSFLNIAATRKRVMAFLVDAALAFTVTIVSSIITHLPLFIAGNYFFDFNIFIFFTFLFIYSTLFEGFAGQTVGKSILGLKVVNLALKKMSYDIAAIRNFGKCFLLPIDLIAGIRIKDKRYIKYFDKFSGTTVINIRP